METKPAIEAKPATPTQSISRKAKPRMVHPLTIEAVTVEAKIVKPKTIQPKTIQPKTIQPKTIQPKTIQPKPMKAKPMETKTTKPPSRYEGSLAQKWDQTLLAGGTWAEMAQVAGVTPGRLRAHAKHRTDVMKAYRLEENGDLIRLVRWPVEVASQ